MNDLNMIIKIFLTRKMRFMCSRVGDRISFSAFWFGLEIDWFEPEKWEPASGTYNYRVDYIQADESGMGV